MKLAVVGGLCIFILSQLAHGDLKTRYQEELLAEGTISCPSKTCPSASEIESYQYIFIDGFMSEVAQSNFVPALKVVQDQWKLNDVVLMRPSSFKSIPENSEIIYQTLLNLRAYSPHRRTLIIAHSKGAPETLLALLHHPDLIKEKGITDFISIDGALGGTPLADLWTILCKNPPQDTLVVETNHFCKTFKKWDSPLRSLKPASVQPLIESAISSLKKHDFDFLSKHMWSVEGQWADFSQEWSSSLMGPHLYLQALYGDNDGVIPVTDQKFPLNFGRNMGLFIADHMGLTDSSDKYEKEMAREAFMRALLREVIVQRLNTL